MRVVRAALVAGLLGLTTAAPASAAGLRLGFTDDATFSVAAGSHRRVALERARETGSTYVRFFLSWADVAPVQPASAAAARNPAWEGYNWSALDAVVRDIAAAGLQPLPVVYEAPKWAEGPGRPRLDDAPRGSWRPSPAQLGRFAQALVSRYSGSHPDPAVAGASLPRVSAWQAWNEPNLDTYVTPQWRRRGAGWAAASPAIYRKLLNAFYAGVKRADRAATVVSAGTAPYGDLRAGDRRMPPARFWRELLCVRGRGSRPKALPCAKVRFDVVAHHPYPIGPPRRKARNADDVVVPDLKKILVPLKAAQRKGTVLPRGSKPLWVTEIAWDSRPDPDGLSLTEQATYLEGAFNVLWRQGASVVIWFLMRDQSPEPSYATTHQSGVFTRAATIDGDTRKPSFTAFRFPFTAYRTRGVARLWGLAPAGNEVVVEVKRSGGWTQAARLKAGPTRIFSGRLRVGRGTVLRARNGAETSLSWTVF